MTLADEAADFIERGSFRDEEELLVRCVESRALDGLIAVQRIFEDMHGGITFNTELKAPAAFALIAWREVGLRALIEATARTATSKNRSLTVDVLATLAASEQSTAFGGGRFDKLERAVNEAVGDWASLQALARRMLSEFILSLPDDDEATEVIALQMMLWRRGTTRPRELFSALAGRLVSVSRAIIGGYRQLLLDHPAEEPRFQAFFERVPQLLDPMVKTVWPKPNLFGRKEPDFVVQRSDGAYVVIEIEAPAKQLLTQSGQPSAEATHAVAQVVDYMDYLVQHLPEAAKVFPGLRNPEGLVVIGLESPLSAEQQRRLVLENHSRRTVRVVGFDWIADRAESISQNIIAEAPRLVRTRTR